MYEVDRKRIKEWCSNAEKITIINNESGSSKRKRLHDSSRKITDTDLKDEMVEWIHSHRENMYPEN